MAYTRHHTHPAWSPDGKNIAFCSNAVRGNRGIYIMDTDGENVRPLTDWRGSKKPAWSPDGEKIAFCAGKIYVMDAQEGNVHKFNRHPLCTSGPTWSPDAQRLAFNRNGAAGGIFALDADGQNLRQLTDQGENYPAWSPDGQQIAFSYHRGEDRVGVQSNDGIFVVDINNGRTGGAKHRLTVDEDWDPAWSPDGQQIVFVSNRDGNAEIYIMDADGRNQERLTHHRASDLDPEWFEPGYPFSVSSAGKVITTWAEIKRSK